ncbi:MAG: hypothetical protein ACI39U_02985 [Candidatus Cryptobacteroides sp.]
MLGPIINFMVANSLAGNITKDLKKQGYMLGKSLPEGCRSDEQEKAARKEEDREDVVTVVFWCFIFFIFLVLATLSVD